MEKETYRQYVRGIVVLTRGARNAFSMGSNARVAPSYLISVLHTCVRRASSEYLAPTGIGGSRIVNYTQKSQPLDAVEQ